MSTIRASHLMAGKIIGVGSAAVAQVAIWVAIAAVLVSHSRRTQNLRSGPSTTPSSIPVVSGRRPSERVDPLST
jgi:ABC-type Na+ efflux pump permease subunit